MGTASTKSRGNRQKGWEAKTSEGNETQSGLAASTTADAGGELSRGVWWIAYASVMLVAALVRFYQLELRPMHHDEGVNGFFLNNLIRTGVFRYDPTNYHGPTLYYFTLPLAVAAERLQMYGTWTVRLLPLIFGLATIWLALGLRRYIGRVGALSAGALLALSPGVVFFSRYFIHEMMFVFFTFGIVVAALRFYEHDAPPDSESASQRIAPAGLGIAAASLVMASLVAAYRPEYYRFALAWILFSVGALFVLLRQYEGARSIYLVLAAVSAALLFATKETAFISVGVLLIAWAMAWGYTSLAARLGWFGARVPHASSKRARGRQSGKGDAGGDPIDRGGLVRRVGGWPRLLILFAVALGLFLFVNILFYSSFFTNAKGVWDAVEAYKVWKKTGESGFHGYGWHKYLQWLVIDRKHTPAGEKWEFGEEPVLFLLACLGAVLALRETRRRFPLFAALWGFGLLAAYSLIKYKTPWLVLSMLVPFAITGGFAIDWLYRRGAAWRTPTFALLYRVAAFVLLGVALIVAAIQTVQLNYVHYDEDPYIYVYAHTRREYLDMIREVERIAERAGTGYETHINVAAPEYWPMPWYLRDYKRVAYQGRVIPTTADAVVIASTTQSAEMQAKNGANYQLVGTYPMRPGVTLNLYARRDLARQ